VRDDLEEAMAAYKHLQSAGQRVFDGMNLVAKEGPIRHEREGVSILSENTGAHESSASTRCRSTRSTSRSWAGPI